MNQKKTNAQYTTKTADSKYKSKRHIYFFLAMRLTNIPNPTIDGTHMPVNIPS